jgi:hypothetical protein
MLPIGLTGEVVNRYRQGGLLKMPRIVLKRISVDAPSTKNEGARKSDKKCKGEREKESERELTIPLRSVNEI